LNILLYKAEELSSNQLLEVDGRRARHLLEVLNVNSGRQVKVGCLNGAIGRAEVLSQSKDKVTLSLLEDAQAAACLETTQDSLILALPRPQMLKRIFQTIAIFGIKDLHLIDSARVDKSFFMSKQLSAERIEENLLLGLEQSGRTRLPKVHLHSSFKKFLSSETLDSSGLKLISHPYTENSFYDLERSFEKPSCLAIGPEGGWLETELEDFKKLGFIDVSLSKNILKVEQAVTVFLSQLECRRGF